MVDPASLYDSNKETLDAAIVHHATSISEHSNPLFQSLLLAADGSSFATNSDVWVFVAGIIPFGWATIEFWRRIAVGESFGTGSDSVIIGEDSNPDSSRGRRVLGKDALVVAYILFGVAAAVLGVVLYTVVTSDSPPADFASLATSPSTDATIIN